MRDPSVRPSRPLRVPRPGDPSPPMWPTPRPSPVAPPSPSPRCCCGSNENLRSDLAVRLEDSECGAILAVFLTCTEGQHSPTTLQTCSLHLTDGLEERW